MHIKRVEHVAIATRQMDEVKRVFEQILGLPLEYEESFPQYQTRMAMYPIGDTYLEILEGTAESADVEEWIRRRGEGLYHICLEVDDIDEAFAKMRSLNVGILSDKPIAGHADSRVFFLDPRSTAGLLIEFVELPESQGAHLGATAAV